MSERVSIIGLVGPSAVGKGYCKDAIKSAFPSAFDEPVVVTTRPKRPNDGKDRQAGVPVAEFLGMKEAGVVLFAHQPFGEGTVWYGFSRENLEQNAKTLLTEVHIENVVPFKARFQDKVKLIALVAEKDYLETNIRERATETEESIQIRLNAAISEVEEIARLDQQGLIDFVINVSNENRKNLGEIVTKLTSGILK
jgi:guanylate kinase